MNETTNFEGSQEPVVISATMPEKPESPAPKRYGILRLLAWWLSPEMSVWRVVAILIIFAMLGIGAYLTHQSFGCSVNCER